MRSLVQFGPFQVSQGADGAPVELSRGAEEVTCLAYDDRTGTLVELHIIPASAQWSSAEKAEFLKRARLAGDLGESVFPRVLEAGEHDGLSWFSMPLQDGEPVEKFVSRVGALAETAALELVREVAGALVRLEPYVRLITGTRLHGAVMALGEPASGLNPPLEIRVVDLGLSFREVRSDGLDAYPVRLGLELVQLLYLLLAGKPCGPSEARNAQEMGLAMMPPALRDAIKRAGAGQNSNLPDLHELVALFDEAVSRRPESLRRESLRISPSRHPLSALSKLLPEESAFISFLESGEWEPDANAGDPGMYCCAVTGPNGPQTLILEAPGALMGPEIPAENARLITDRLLRAAGHAESPGLRVVIEERGGGFFVSEVLEARGGRLDLPETVSLLEQVIVSLDQAKRLGGPLPRLFPSHLFLSLENTAPDPALKGQKLSVWPKFKIKLRAHPTLRSRLVPSVPPFNKYGYYPASAERRLEAEFVQLAALLMGGREAMVADLILGKALQGLLDKTSETLSRGQAVPLAQFAASLKSLPAQAFAQNSQFPPSRADLTVPRGPERSPIAVAESESAEASSTSPLTPLRTQDKRKPFFSLVNHLWK